MFNRLRVKVLWLILIPVALAGCQSPIPRGETGGSQGVVFIPPTLAVTATNIPPTATTEPAKEDGRPTPTPPCTANLRFVEDATVPDGTEVAAGSFIDKRWAVENNGSCNWDKNYSLRLISGPGLGTGGEEALFPARAGVEAVIRLVFAAPLEPGAYQSAWQAYTPEGEAFGEVIFINIVVPGEGD